MQETVRRRRDAAARAAAAPPPEPEPEDAAGSGSSEGTVSDAACRQSRGAYACPDISPTQCARHIAALAPFPPALSSACSRAVPPRARDADQCTTACTTLLSRLGSLDCGSLAPVLRRRGDALTPSLIVGRRMSKTKLSRRTGDSSVGPSARPSGRRSRRRAASENGKKTCARYEHVS